MRDLPEFGSACEFKVQVFISGMLADPARKLHCSNVITLPVMGAAFTDENFVTIFQLVQHLCAFDLKLQISFVSGKQDGKRGQWNIFRCIDRHFGKCLAVGDDKAWLFAKRRKCFLQFCVTGYNRDCTSLQYIADGLLLREDQTSFWGGRVDRDDQNDKIIWI